MIRRKADSKNGETVKEGYAVQPDRRSAGQGEVKRHIGWKILSVQDFAINISDRSMCYSENIATFVVKKPLFRKWWFRK